MAAHFTVCLKSTAQCWRVCMMFGFAWNTVLSTAKLQVVNKTFVLIYDFSAGQQQLCIDNQSVEPVIFSAKCLQLW